MAIDDFIKNKLGRTGNALQKKLSQKAGNAISGLDEPWRSAARNLVDTALPGFGGGTPDLRDNTYANIIQGNLAQSFLEFENVVGAPGVLTQITDEGTSKSYDWRARLRPKAGGIDQFYAEAVENGFVDDFLMRPIKESNGLVWQQTPTVTLSNEAAYNSEIMQGMNYPINTYNYSRPGDIPVIADFTANTIEEARYMLAVFTFLKIATKSYFGDTAVATGKYGTPPPVLLFEYLGDHGFNKVPVVVTRYDIQYLPDSQYVPVNVQGTITYVPTICNISVTLLPTYTPHKLRRRYSVEGIANGASYRDGFI